MNYVHSAIAVVSLDTKHFIKHSGVKSALSTLILVIPLSLSIWTDADVLVSIFFVAITGGLNAFFVYYDYKQPSMDIKEILELMVKNIWGSNMASNFRANVMLYDAKSDKLQIKDSYNMLGQPDRYISLHTDQGCAGRAFKDEKPFWVDLTTCTHEKYLVDSSRVWSDMKSVMSVPIWNDDKVIGTLNIDSTLDLSQAFMEQGEINQKILNTTIAYSDLVARWL